MPRNSAENSAKFALELSIKPAVFLQLAQPLLETWSWTERIKASLKTIGARRECSAQNPSRPPYACHPALPGSLPAPIRHSGITEVAGFGRSQMQGPGTG